MLNNPEPPAFIVGDPDPDPDFFDIYLPEEELHTFEAIEENDVFTQYRATLDLTGDGEENLNIDVFAAIVEGFEK